MEEASLLLSFFLCVQKCCHGDYFRSNRCVIQLYANDVPPEPNMKWLSEHEQRFTDYPSVISLWTALTHPFCYSGVCHRQQPLVWLLRTRTHAHSWTALWNGDVYESGACSEWCSALMGSGAGPLPNLQGPELRRTARAGLVVTNSKTPDGGGGVWRKWGTS